MPTWHGSMAALAPKTSPWTLQPLALEVPLPALMAVPMLHAAEAAAEVLGEQAARPGAGVAPEADVLGQEVVKLARPPEARQAAAACKGAAVRQVPAASRAWMRAWIRGPIALPT